MKGGESEAKGEIACVDGRCRAETTEVQAPSRPPVPSGHTRTTSLKKTSPNAFRGKSTQSSLSCQPASGAEEREGESGREREPASDEFLGGGGHQLWGVIARRRKWRPSI